MSVWTVGPGAVARLAMPACASAAATSQAECGRRASNVVEPAATTYIKCRASGTPLLSGDLARFELLVEEVLEDEAAEGEAGARITGGLTYAPVPALDSGWARAVLATLRV